MRPVRASVLVLVLSVLAIGPSVAGAASAAPSGPPRPVAVIPLPSQFDDASSMAIDPLTHRLYASSSGTFQIHEIDLTTNTIVSTVSLHEQPCQIAVNPATNRVYVTLDRCPPIVPLAGTGAPSAAPGGRPATTPGTGSLLVLDGASLAPLAQIPTGFGPDSVAVDALANKIYVGNAGCVINNPPFFVPDNSVTAIDGSTNVGTKIQAGPLSIFTTLDAVSVEPTLHQVYASFFNGLVTTIDGTTNTVSGKLHSAFGAVDMDTNASTHRLYVATSEGPVSVFDAQTGAFVANVTLPGDQVGHVGTFIAVNPTLNRAYVSKSFCQSPCTVPDVWVLDGATNTAPVSFTVRITPSSLATDPTTNRLYMGAGQSILVFQDS
jgi:DNA-binding beta-propeller fold protein YncE